MSFETEKYCALLEQRVLLLQALAEQLVACRKEFVAMDLDGMYGRIAAQEALCRKIQSLRPAIDALQRISAHQLILERLDGGSQPHDVALDERLRIAKRELNETRAEVSRLNQIHAAYLRRSCRTVNMLTNLLSSYALTYAPPLKSSLPLLQTGGGR